MLHKLTAWMLALLIASPMCWCGWMHSAKAAETAETPSCCPDRKTHEHKSTSEDGKDCPCAQAPKARDLAASKILVPAAPLVGDALMLWTPVELQPLWRSEGFQPLSFSLAHGPPWHGEPLFVRHCALLI